MEITKHKKTKLSVCVLAFGFFTAASALANDVSREITEGSFNSQKVYAADNPSGTVDNSSLTVNDADGTKITITNWSNFYGGLHDAGVTGTSALTVSGLKYSPTSSFSNSTKVALYGGGRTDTANTRITTGDAKVLVSSSEIYANIYGGTQSRGSGVVVTAGTTYVGVSNVRLSGYNPTSQSYYPGTIYGSAYVDQNASYDGGAATVVVRDVNGVNYDENGSAVDDPGAEIYGGGQLYGDSSKDMHLSLASTDVSVGGSATYARLVVGGSQISGTPTGVNYVSSGHTKVSVDGGTYERLIVGGNRSNWFGRSYVGVSDGNGGWQADASSKYATEVIVKATNSATTAAVVGGSLSESPSLSSTNCAPDAYVYGDTHVRVESGATVAEIIGGGFAETFKSDGTAAVAAKSVVYGDTHVELAGGNATAVVGGGYYYAEPYQVTGENGETVTSALPAHDGAMVVGDTYVSISSGNVSENIVAGGVNSSVDGNTNLVISGGSIGGNVYAGSVATGPTAGVDPSGNFAAVGVSGNATVTISGGTFAGGAVIDGCAGTVEGTSVLNIVNTDATAGTTIQNFDKVVVSGTSNFTIGAVADGVTVTAFGGTLAGTQFTAGTVANVSADDSGAISQENQSVAANTSVTISQKSDTVTLSTASTAITVSKAESLDTGTVSVSEIGAVVLSAWSFAITNSGADVMVTLDVGQDVALDSIRVYHEENGDWTDVTDQVGNIVSKNGKVSFTTNKFSGYAVAAVPSIPEPSTFGLLAGLAALALAGTRRRRRKA